MNRSAVRWHAIFVSSTSEDLKEHRQIARDMILDRNCLPVQMEYFPDEFKKTLEVIEEYLRNCDAVVLIAGASYGSPANHEKSYVEWEFEQAQKIGLLVVSLILSPR